MKNISFKSILPHFLAVVCFAVMALAYNSPVLEGKRLNQHDVKQAMGTSKQSKDYYEKTNELPFWSPQMFSGMPAYMIYMNYNNSLPVHIGRFFVGLLPEPANLCFLYMLGAYVAMLLLGFNPWISVLGAVGYAFASYNLINIGAGHISKAIAVATIPPLIASVVYTYRTKKYLLGGVLVMFFSAVHQYSNFIQMTYYVALSLGLYAIYEFVQAIRNKQQKAFWIASATVLVAGFLSIATHYSRYVVLSEYTAQTTRGKSDLSQKAEFVVNPQSNKDNSKNASKKEGLDKSYAFQWSYGKLETNNLFIPDFYGGASAVLVAQPSAENLKKTDTYKVVSKIAGEDAGFQLASSVGYWGEQPGTGGPAYMGAIVLFLAVLGLVASKNNLKWWLLGSFGLFLSIAWGKNFFLNDILFDYLPLFNKFRAVTMILSITPLFLVILAGLGIFEFFKLNDLQDNLKENLQEAQRQEQYKHLLKSLKISTGIVGGMLLVWAVLGGILLDFKAENDSDTLAYLQKALNDQAAANQIMQAMRSDRASLLQADSFRSLVFVVLVAGLLWAYLKKYFSINILMSAVIFLTVLDLWVVDKRYLNNASFVSKSQTTTIALTPASEQILKDTTHYRVFNLAENPFSDATTSYYHNSVGGYHAAKLGRYQDLIDTHLSKQNIGVWNMFNIKYIISQDQKGNLISQQNPDALGSAWFVDNYKIVANADEELKSLSNINPKKITFIDKKFEKQLSGLTFMPDSAATIRLTVNTPNKMVYSTNAKTSQLAIFSEIYYLTSQSGWQAFIDGKPVEHLRANYVLRGLVIPAGKHTIEFRFEATSYQNAEKLNLGISIIFALLIVFALFWEWRKSKKSFSENPTEKFA
jgi:hypothetical protein